MTVAKRVLYQGRVQGVGFRYTAHGVAQRFAVGGYVKNLPDGRVELVAEGDAAEVDRFLEALARRMTGYIETQEVRDMAAAGFASFDIRV
ncbi:MAG: acylphosphatase [Gemmataceae bacterium]|nr:acylphosphatase [Gemmataceae bacterium]